MVPARVPAVRHSGATSGSDEGEADETVWRDHSAALARAAVRPPGGLRGHPPGRPRAGPRTASAGRPTPSARRRRLGSGLQAARAAAGQDSPDTLSRTAIGPLRRADRAVGGGAGPRGAGPEPVPGPDGRGV